MSRRWIFLGAVLSVLAACAWFTTSSRARGIGVVPEASSTGERVAGDPSLVGATREVPRGRTVRRSPPHVETEHGDRDVDRDVDPQRQEAPRRGLLEVRLVDGGGVPVGPARVLVRATEGAALPEAAHVLEVSEGGGGDLELAAGSWRVEVDPEGLPAGYGAPLRQHQVARHLEAPGWFARVTDVRPGETARLLLRCHALAEVFGRVARSDGGPVHGLPLQLRSEVPGAVHALATDTDAAGRFRFEGVPPGAHVLRAFAVEEEGGPRVSRALELEVPEGARVDAGSLQLVARGARVHGRVADREGRPFAGLPLAVYAPGERWTEAVSVARTDELGRFVFEGVPCGDWRAVVTDLPWELEDWMEPRSVVVASVDRSLDVGTFELARSHPFELGVTVRVAGPLEERLVRVAVEHRLEEEASRAPLRAVRVRDGTLAPGAGPRDVRFLWRTKLARGRVTVVVRLGGVTRERLVDPVPDGRADVHFDLGRVVPGRRSAVPDGGGGLGPRGSRR